MKLLRIFSTFSLRTKFVVAISALLIGTIISLSSYLNSKQAESYRREVETSGETMIRMMAISAEDGILFDNEFVLQDVLNILSQFDQVTYAAISNTENEVKATYGEWNDVGITVLREINRDDPESARCNDSYIIDETGNEFIELNYPVVTIQERLDRENLGLTGGIDNTLAKDYITEEIGSIRMIISLEHVNEAISDAKTTSILITIFVSLLAIMLLTIFIRLITRPIKQLVHAADKIIHGDLSTTVDIVQKDEIGHLASTFNQMVESLKISRDEIEEYNRTLEEKIIERTLELEDAQAQLVQSEKLSAIGQLAAGVAHELNNPLGGILGYAQFTLEKMKKNVPEETTAKEMNNYIKYLTDIEKQSRRCKNIVQNLLRFSRSSKTTEFIEVNINQVIDDTCTFVEHQLNMNMINLNKSLDPELPPVQANPGQLQQVFTNLIINAMHASPPETSIEVSTHFCPALGEFDGTVEIICKDEGKGIPAENIKKIFEPFFTTKEVGKGTGLGLAVSYGIVKEHGGEIKVESTVGKGTTFTIILPLQKKLQQSDTENNTYNSEFTDNTSR